MAATDEPTWARFVETPNGLRLVHRIVLAAMYVITQCCGGGIRQVCEFLVRSGLSSVVASSFGSVRRAVKAMEEKTIAFGAAERDRLGQKMKPKSITLAEDETFHGGVPCLVAMEVVSNFLLVEEYASDRRAATWTSVVNEALDGLPVEVEQCVVDGACALRSHAERGLDAHVSPDLFHVRQDVGRATSTTLRRRIEKAERDLADAEKVLDVVVNEAERYVEASRGPGRPRDYERRIEDAYDKRDAAAKAVAQAEAEQQTVRDAAEQLSTAHHAYDLKTGAPRDADELKQTLTGGFARIDEVADRVTLRASARRLIRRARAVVPKMVATMTFVHTLIRARIDTLDVSDELRRLVEQVLVPAHYLETAARKAPTAERRDAILDAAASLRAPLAVPGSPWSELDAKARAELSQFAQQCADRFQRSSSCVEGRNGVLALRRHSLHSLGKRKLEALTVMHNYAARRHDGTTAAERFFGAPARDLFEHLLDALPPPKRPGRRRRPATPPENLMHAA